MRIGIDMLAVQSPGSRLRGIGRYGHHLVKALLERGRDHEFILYEHDGFPVDQVPRGSNAVHSTVRIERERGEYDLRDAIDRIARTNPDELDALLILSPFELCPGYDPPHKPLHSLKMAVVMHDLIPFLFQEHYLDDPGNADWFYRRLNTLRRYDLLLTNSHATRTDCLAKLDLPDDRVVTIAGAGNGTFFAPDRSVPMPYETRAALRKFRIRRPYVLTVAGIDERKNIKGLMDAFRLLPAELRHAHDLVVTCFLNDSDERKVRNLAEERGLSDHLVLTGEVSDDELRVLYQRCATFAFPSKYEGLGLPLLEAMHCGAVVLAGNNSSQIEVVGNAGLLANAHDSSDIAAKLELALSDFDLAATLGKQAVIQASTYTWELSADRALAALNRPRRKLPTGLRADHGHSSRPRIAVVSPWEPKKSGISTYSRRLVGELAKNYAVDLYHDEGYVPDLSLGSPRFACYDYRLFARNAAVRDYRGIIYHMGNSWYHGFIFEMLQQFPGVVALHDFYLAGFQYWFAHLGPDPMKRFEDELRYCHPARAEEILPQLDDWTKEPGGMQSACTHRELAMNRRIFEYARTVVVHSPWCREQARATNPAFATKTVVVPHGATVASLDPLQRQRTRARFAIPDDALVFASFGGLSSSKMNIEAIDAFRVIAAERSEALFLFVGQDWENGEARARVEDLRLEGRVRFFGQQSDDEFASLIAATDIGVALRRPPTYGETSGALLDLLRHGIPAIVNDVATFADFPDTVVRKVDFRSQRLDGLIAAFRDLADDPQKREALRRAGREHVAVHHSWSRAASLYSEAIEHIHRLDSETRNERRKAAFAGPSAHFSTAGGRRSFEPGDSR